MASASPPPDNGPGQPIFALLQLPGTSTYEEVYGAYSDFVQEYVKEHEYVKTLKVAERKLYNFQISGKQFSEVSVAFLSYMEKHEAEQSNRPFVTDSHSVKHNSCSLTVYIPQDTVASWRTVCESYYGVKGKDHKTNGVQYSAMFKCADPQFSGEFGSIHITVYDSKSSKLLIQGSSYVLWLCSHYDILRAMVMSNAVDQPPSRREEYLQRDIPGPHAADGDTFTKCAVCNKIESDGEECEVFVKCDDCLSWTHFDCTGLDEETKSLLRNTDEEYYCINCQIPTEQRKSMQTKIAPPPLIAPRVEDNGANKHANHGKCMTIESQSSDGEKVGKLQTALLELETSLASLKVQSNAFETNVSNQLDTIFKALPTGQNTTSKKYDSEITKLREENTKLRNRVQTLEVLVKSLQSKSSDIEKDMSDVKTSQGSLKVKVANIKDAILDKVTTTIDGQPPCNQHTVLQEYAIATTNRFEVLQDSPTTDLDTDPKALIQSITNNKAHPNPRPQHSTYKSKRVVIIGDSNAQKLKPGLLSPTADVPKPYWAPTLPDTLSTLETISKEKSPPSTVVLHVGTNDAVTKSTAEIIDDFDTTISSTQSLFPNAEVVISAVPPRRATGQNPAINKDITAINKHLLDRCQANPAFTFVNHTKLWNNDDHNKVMFERDGYHLNADGVRVLAYNIKKQATGPLGLQPRNPVANERRQENLNSSPSIPRQQNRRYDHPKGRRTEKPNVTSQGHKGHTTRKDTRGEAAPHDSRKHGRQAPPVQGYNQAYQSQYMPGPFDEHSGPYHPSPMYTEWNREWPSITEAYGGNLTYPMWVRPPPPPRYNNGPPHYNGPYGVPPRYNSGPYGTPPPLNSGPYGTTPPYNSGPYGTPPPYNSGPHGTFSRPSGRPQGSN